MIGILVVFFFSFIFLCLFLKNRFNYWKNRHVPYFLPAFGKPPTSPRDRQAQYFDFKGKFPFYGSFFLIKPAAVITDLNLVKRILVEDFQHFHDRGIFVNAKNDPLSSHLVNLSGQQWKNLRSKLTPTFSSGKMKNMFPIFVEIGQLLVEVLKKEDENKKIYLKEYLDRFSADIIENCAFGLEHRSLRDPEDKFLKMGRKVLQSTPGRRIKFLIQMLCPTMARLFGIRRIPDDISEYFVGIVEETVQYRLKNKVERNDFMNLLIQLHQDGGLSMGEIAAQAFVFFIAGFDTASNVINFTLYELCMNPEIQERARHGINDTLEKHEGKLSYEAVNEMSFLDQCVNETLRKYPSFSALLRVVTKDYRIPETDSTLEKGIFVAIPVFAIHHDPQFHPDPEKYDPERFSPDKVKDMLPFSFIPFGFGLRNCIGARFGQMETRAGLAILLKNFRFSLSKEQKRKPLELIVTNISTTTSKEKICMKIERI